MEGFWQMLSIQMLLFVYMAIGYGLRKGKILKAEARDAFTEFVILVTLPCMIFESFQITLTVETLQKGLLSLFVASSVEVLSLIISNVAFRFCKKDEIPIMRYGTLVSNSGFAGLPVIENGYGLDGLFYASLYIIPTRILMWAGISLFTTAPRWERIKGPIHLGIIAVELGLLVMLFEPDLPLVAVSAIHQQVNASTPCYAIIVG